MKPNLCLGGCIMAAAAIVTLVGCSTSGNAAKKQAGYTQNQVDAQALFTKNCANCHGKDGRAKTFRGHLTGARNFTDTHWQATTSNETIVHTIKTGSKPMRAFGEKLSESEIQALAAYVQTFKTAN